jgi:FkbM family methyltransferase
MPPAPSKQQAVEFSGKMERIKSLIKRTPLARPIRAVLARYESYRMPGDVFREFRDDSAMVGILDRVLAPGSSCVDIGANRGRMLERIVQRSPNGQHHAFEPLPHLAALLRDRFPGVTVHELALANQTGRMTFHHVVSLPSLSGLRRQREDQLRGANVEEITVSLARLDDTLPEDLPVTLIKIDVEGAEVEALSGGLETIQRCRPVVLFEYAQVHGELFGTTPDVMHDFLTGPCGFHVHSLIGRRRQLSRKEFRKVCGAAASTDRFEENFLALPAERADRWGLVRV